MKIPKIIHENPIPAGIAGGVALLLFYFAILSLANSPEHAISQFLGMWYWVLALAIGFGVQIGLYAHMSGIAQRAGVSITAGVAASGGMSTTAMAACCAHHVADVAPLVGLTVVSAFLVKYQTAFLVIGVLSNIIGIVIMVRAINKMKTKKCH